MKRAKISVSSVLAAALVAAAAAQIGCVCTSPIGHITFVAMPPSGDDLSAFAIDCVRACGSAEGCKRTTADDGTPGIECGIYEAIHYCGGAGRRPLGLARSGRRREARRLGRRARGAALLAQMAHLEAASIVAFEELATHLEALRAPDGLVTRARAAATEEARHASVIGGLARRSGARPRPAHTQPVAEPSLEGLAIANAVEGCVLETFAALLALHQSRAATDRRFREAMRSIASEEASHAQLARDVDDWARTRLDPAAIERLDRAHRTAWTRLARVRPADALPRLGLPGGRERAHLAVTLAAALAPMQRA